jgi:hypothetical protein
MTRVRAGAPPDLLLWCAGLNFGRTITALYSFGLTLGTIYRCGLRTD